MNWLVEHSTLEMLLEEQFPDTLDLAGMEGETFRKFGIFWGLSGKFLYSFLLSGGLIEVSNRKKMLPRRGIA